jgi:hypothetical protein
MEEGARQKLHRSLEEALGAENALTLMSALSREESATKADVRLLKDDMRRLKDDIRLLREHIDQVEARVTERIDLRVETAEHRLAALIQGQIVSMTRTFVVAMVGAVVTVGGLAVTAARF